MGATGFDRGMLFKNAGRLWLRVVKKNQKLNGKLNFAPVFAKAEPAYAYNFAS